MTAHIAFLKALNELLALLVNPALFTVLFTVGALIIAVMALRLAHALAKK